MRGMAIQGLYAPAERIHGFRTLRALLRRVLRRARPDPNRLLARAHLRRDDSVRYGSFAPRRPGAHAKRPARTLHGRRLAGAPARPRGSRTRPRRHGRALTPALRPRRGGRALPQVRVDRPEGRVCLRPLPGFLLRVVLLPEELRFAGLPLASAGRRHRAAPGRDRVADGRPHAGPPVLAGRVARDGPGHPHRRRLLLAGARGQRAGARRGLEPRAGAALAQEAEDDRAAGARSYLSRSRPGLLENRQTGAGRLSVRDVVRTGRVP